MAKSIIIIGGGLVGAVAALAFAKKGFQVEVYESRPDPRSKAQIALSNSRSINLAISARGLLALESIDEATHESVLKEVIPMHGRMVHDGQGHQISQNYGLHGEAINSINREILNRMLLDQVADLENVTIKFGHKLEKADFVADSPKVWLSTDSGETVETSADVIIGADGSYSRTRQQLQRVVNMNYQQEYIDHYYLELMIPNTDGNFALSPNHLHIWPRHQYMLIALANQDTSFTVTLFAPKVLFNELEGDDGKITAFFSENFPDAMELIGVKEVLRCFNQNPKGSLVCVKCSPYNYKGKAIIIGDAAHSTVPFYGQGMNCGFEDVRVLMGLLEKYDYDFLKSFDEYTATRHKDLVSIIDLSMRNYVEMRHNVVTARYLLRKKIDGWLCKLLGDSWLPLYTMVSFRPDISYSQAISKEAKQTKILQYGENVVFAAGLIGAAAFAWNKFAK